MNLQQIEESAGNFKKNNVVQDITTRILQNQNPEMAGVSAVVARVYNPAPIAPATAQSVTTIEKPNGDGEFSSPLAGALYCASRNIPQIPLRPRSKEAFLKGWKNLATTDAEQIKQWASQHPACNFGSVAKHDGILIFETDSADVRKRFAGKFSSQFLVQSSTDERGHRYYKNLGIANISQKENKYVDFSLRAHDMYCTTAGSIHPETGKQYRLVSDGPIAEPTKEEIDFWNSESKEPVKKVSSKKASSESPESLEKGDPGFKKLFDAVGWKPLIDRLSKHLDSRFHNPVLEPGKMMHCPLPGHYKPEDINEKFGATPFGVVDGSLLHCFACNFNGDMIAACNALDNNSSSGLVASVSMYETARCIAEENGLKFEDYFPDQPKVLIESVNAVDDVIDENSEAAIPAFDPSVVNGIYKKFVDLVTHGTTLAPQFTYAIAKTIIGTRMAGKVRFENLDVEPRFYAALIGETGSGKGEAWKRIRQIIQPEGSTEQASRIKIVNSADSGAGLRDFFFQSPAEYPVLCYVDEIESLGNRATSTRNPGIIDQMIELADSTNISRVLAKKKGQEGGTKSKSDARLSIVMCGQSGDVYMRAFAGRTKLGIYDRLTPEYGVAVEAGDLPVVDVQDAYKLLLELNTLDYSGTMKMSADCKARLESFWKLQTDDVRKKARWKKNLFLDAFMSAFGRGIKVADTSDADIAIKIFTRQLIIRRACFTSEVPDRIGYYLGLIKRITEHMTRRLAASVPAEAVAKSRRDYERETNAHRDNEEHIFNRAWDVHSKVHLTAVRIKKANGQVYTKYLPAED